MGMEGDTIARSQISHERNFPHTEGAGCEQSVVQSQLHKKFYIKSIL